MVVFFCKGFFPLTLEMSRCAQFEAWNLEDAKCAWQAYVEALGPLAVSDTDLSQPGSYNSHYQKLAAATPGDVAAKMKRLQRELRNLNTKTQLPVHAAASIFVRHDSERIDKMRVVITGESFSSHNQCLTISTMFRIV